MTGGGDSLPFVAVGVGVSVTGRVPLGARVSVGCAGKVRETGCVGVSLEAAVGVAVLVGRAGTFPATAGLPYLPARVQEISVSRYQIGILAHHL